MLFYRPSDAKPASKVCRSSAPGASLRQTKRTYYVALQQQNHAQRSGRRGPAGPVRTRCRDRRQDLGTVPLELRRAHALDPAQRGERRRPGLGDRRERRVVGDDEGRHARRLGPAPFATPAALRGAPTRRPAAPAPRMPSGSRDDAAGRPCRSRQVGPRPGRRGTRPSRKRLGRRRDSRPRVSRCSAHDRARWTRARVIPT